MGRVPGQEHPTGRIPLRHPFGRVPGRLAADLHVQVGYADRVADLIHAPLVGEVLQRLALIRVPRRVEDPLGLVVHRQQRPVRTRARQVADDEAQVAQHLDELLRAEGDAHVVEELAIARLGDPQLFPDGAARSVRGDQEVGAHRDVLARLPVLHHGVHPRGVLVEAHQLGGEPDVCAHLATLFGQHRLDVVLAAQTPAGRTEPGQRPGRVDRLDQPVVVAVGQRPGLQNALISLQYGRRPADRALRPCRAEQLHRPGIDATAPRVCGGAGVLLDQQVPHSVAAQEKRGGQAHEGAAHDENRYANIGVVFHQLRAPVFCVGEWTLYAPDPG